MATRLDRQLDELHGAPLSAFIRLRDRLTRQLRDAGRHAQAAEVRRLGKPSAPVWTINQLARQDAPGMQRFLDTVNHLKRAHLKGSGEVGQATMSQRAALTALLDRAEGIMEAAGMKPAPATRRRLSDTLLGAAADHRLQQDLRRGRLTAERHAPGFEVLTGSHLQAVPGTGAERAPQQPKAKSGSEDRKATEQARRAASAEARRKARQARQLERLAARHQRAADAAATRAEALGRKLQALREKAAAERAAADESAREVARLRSS